MHDLISSETRPSVPTSVQKLFTSASFPLYFSGKEFAHGLPLIRGVPSYSDAWRGQWIRRAQHYVRAARIDRVSDPERCRRRKPHRACALVPARLVALMLVESLREAPENGEVARHLESKRPPLPAL